MEPGAAKIEIIELPITGMDCADCARHVQQALLNTPGVKSADVYLLTEKAVLAVDPDQMNMGYIEAAVGAAGYGVGRDEDPPVELSRKIGLQRSVGRMTAGLFVAVILVVLFGEILGLFDFLNENIPWLLGLALVLVAGFPIFKAVVVAGYHRQVTSHTLMSIGVLAALTVGEWVTALVVVFFMRVGDYVERFTTDQARQAIKQLQLLAPETARVQRDGTLIDIPVDELKVGDVVEIRPGEKIPVDGVVDSGQATINQSTITGESLPVEAGPGAHVFAATLAQYGSIRVRTTDVGSNTTFGRIIRMVEEAESQRSEVQRFADKFSTFYLPIVLATAALTYLISGDALATAAVLVVACSCSIALATPIAMLASIGTAAKSGLLIKGGKYIEILERIDVLLIDKTGTLTLGKPSVVEVIPFNGMNASHLVQIAASSERYSEHPLAEAIRSEAISRNLELYEPTRFVSTPGKGVEALVNGMSIRIGNSIFVNKDAYQGGSPLKSAGTTMVYIEINGELAGSIALADTLRQEVPEALQKMREIGIRKIVLLTGDGQEVARQMAAQLEVEYQAELLPEDKINIVKDFQAKGNKVVMIGDGVNDAPALAQADVGLAMGAAGSDIALEAADVAVMVENWMLIPELFKISQRTMRIVRMNLGLTGVYNLVGITLAAFGIIPPVLAAAAQSIPDLGILANSSRLLRQ